MIIPRFWAEGRIQHKEPKRQITIRRFGWSDISQVDAQAMADERTNKAMQRALRGEKIVRRELKETYGGTDGLPIREEIISVHGSTIITRNQYGALCLNTPDVMFADIDVDDRPRHRMGCGLVAMSLLVSANYGVSKHSFADFLLCLAVILCFAFVIVKLLNFHHRKTNLDPFAYAMKRIEAFAAAQPDWHLRVYQTPAGFRILVMHRVFDPTSEEVVDCFENLDSDKVFVWMCQKQRCFRARVSPKPWRIGIDKHLRPRPGVWPIKPEQMPLREQWVSTYTERADGFASCRFVRSLGSSVTHDDCEAVRAVHDEMTKSDSTLPLA